MLKGLSIIDLIDFIMILNKLILVGWYANKTLFYRYIISTGVIRSEKII